MRLGVCRAALFILPARRLRTPAVSRHLPISSLWFAAVALMSLPAARCMAAAVEFELELKAGDQDRRHSPVRVTLPLPSSLAANARVVLTDAAGQEQPAQLTPPRLLAANKSAAGAPADQAPIERELNFIVERLPRGTTATWKATIRDDASAATASGSQFRWQDTPGDHQDLLYADQPLVRYMYHALDETSKERREETFKPFHHVFDRSGKLLTKGTGGKYTHHRGLFFGFNKITYDLVKVCDTWHCKYDAYQSHDGFLDLEAGPVLGRERVAIGWHGLERKLFANEQRELTVYRPASAEPGILIEFAARVATTDGEVRLDGDPQHAGFHFRAAQEVADEADAKKSQTYFIRPDGVGRPGETRNWTNSGKSKDTGQVNFPWKGMSLVIGGQRYTIAYLDRPSNPKEARFSERDYGRFGSYFEYIITPGFPLEVNYRVWVQAGEMQPEEIAALDDDFVRPIEVVAKQK